MINTLYSFTNYVSTASSHAFSWVKDHKKLLLMISSIAATIFSMWAAAASIRRFNPKLADLLIITSGLSLWIILSLCVAPSQIHGTSSLGRDDSSNSRDDSSSSTDDWIEFSD